MEQRVEGGGSGRTERAERVERFGRPAAHFRKSSTPHRYRHRLSSHSAQRMTSDDRAPETRSLAHIDNPHDVGHKLISSTAPSPPSSLSSLSHVPVRFVARSEGDAIEREPLGSSFHNAAAVSSIEQPIKQPCQPLVLEPTVSATARRTGPTARLLLAAAAIKPPSVPAVLPAHNNAARLHSVLVPAASAVVVRRAIRRCVLASRSVLQLLSHNSPPSRPAAQ